MLLYVLNLIANAAIHNGNQIGSHGSEYIFKQISLFSAHISKYIKIFKLLTEQNNRIKSSEKTGEQWENDP